MNNNIIFSKNNEIVFINGVFAMGYKVELPQKYSLGEQDYVELNEYWNKALRELPIGSIFCKQDVFLKDRVDTSDFPQTNFLQKATKRYFNRQETLSHTCYIFFVLPNKALNEKNITNPFLKLKKTDFTQYDQKINEFIESVNQTVGYLNNIKLQGKNNIQCNELPQKDMEDYYNLYFNLFSSDMVSDCHFKDDHFLVADKYASMVCMLDENLMPEHLSTHQKDQELSNDKSLFFKNYAEDFTFNLKFSHIYNQICFIDDPAIHLNELKKTNDFLRKSSSFDKQNQYFAKITDEIIEDITISTNQRIIRGHNNVMVIANTKEQLKKNMGEVINKFKNMDVKPYLPTGNYLNAIFNYSFPFFNGHFTRYQLYVSSLNVFCSFINNCTSYKNDQKGILYNSRIDNTPVIVDTWDQKKKYVNARNFFILAPTGFGKSFNANHIISGYYAQGVKTVIVDLGGSYKKLAALFPNDCSYITYEFGKSFGVNPFEIEDNLTATKLEELVEFIGVHYKRGEELSQIESTSLRKIIENYYLEEKNDYCLPLFVEFIKNKDLRDLNIKEEFFNKEEFLHLMSDFMQNGTYDFLYKKSEKETFDNLSQKKIIVFELDAVRENHLLLTVMLQLVSSTISNVIWKDKSTRGIVLFDEVAEQLHWNGVLRRIQYFYQAIRKQNGAIGIILQSESQLPDNATSKAIIENTQILYVLNAKDYRSLQKRFGLSEHAYYQLTSITSNFGAKNPYSEIFILRGEKHQVYRLEVPKEVYWAYQTEGAENQTLMEVFQQEKDMEKAIEKFMKDKQIIEVYNKTKDIQKTIEHFINQPQNQII